MCKTNIRVEIKGEKIYKRACKETDEPVLTSGAGLAPGI
jgi:hypothetical protein